MKHKEEFQIEKSIGFLVNRLAFLLRQQMTAKLKKARLDLTPDECVLLNKLWHKDGQMQNELAESTIRDQTTVTRIIDKMEKKNLVKREHSKEDRRKVLAWLTPDGNNLQNKVVPLILEMLGNAGSHVSAKDMEVTISTLQKIIDGTLNNDAM